MQAGKSFSEARGSLTRYLFRVDATERQQIASEMAAQDKKIDEEIAAIQPVIESDAAKAAMEKVAERPECLPHGAPGAHAGADGTGHSGR